MSTVKKNKAGKELQSSEVGSGKASLLEMMCMIQSTRLVSEIIQSVGAAPLQPSKPCKHQICRLWVYMTHRGNVSTTPTTVSNKQFIKQMKWVWLVYTLKVLKRLFRLNINERRQVILLCSGITHQENKSKCNFFEFIHEFMK